MRFFSENSCDEGGQINFPFAELMNEIKIFFSYLIKTEVNNFIRGFKKNYYLATIHLIEALLPVLIITAVSKF
jgi:hypothetical protein